MKTRTAVVGLTALAVANLVLIPLALRHTAERTGPDADAPDRMGGVAARLVPRPQPSPSAASPTASTSALDARYGMTVHATPGSCDGPASTLRLSVDGGRSWQPLGVAAGAVLRILIADANSIWVVGTDTTCRARIYHTVDRGKTWRTLPSTGTWHRPADPDALRVHTPRGSVQAPCGGGPVVEVAARSGAVAALRCGDGAVHRTDDGGRTWTALPPGGTTRALAFAGPGTLYAVSTTADGCTGWRVSRRPVEAWEGVACLPADAVDPPALDAAAALSFVDADSGMLVIGAVAYATSDGGRTWERRTAPAAAAPAPTDVPGTAPQGRTYAAIAAQPDAARTA